MTTPYHDGGKQEGARRKIRPETITTNRRRRHRRRTRRNRNRNKTKEQDRSTPNTSIDTLKDSFDFAAPIQVGRGRKKPPQSTKTKTPGKNNLKMHVDNMNEEQLQQALETIAEDPSIVIIIDNNGNTVEKIMKQQTENPWK